MSGNRKRDPPSDVEATPPSNRRRRNDSDEEDEEENEESSSFESPIRTINPAGRPPEAGIIKRVYLENFMCHRKMTVDLCSNVNFIHGQNGSGKSAILAAVQICLGAGARRTHRARNLKELVRKEAGENCNGAKVRVTLLNGGDDGFQQDVYGDSITVERNISLRASSGAAYKLLDSNGVCKSTSKKDLDAMLDQLNIQVENPVAVLDQEEAKKFLTGKAQDKYQFFAKATELERMDRSYANVVDNITELEENKKKVQESLQSKVDMVRKLKKEWEEYQVLEKLQDKVLDYRVDYAWAFYQTVQQEMDAEVKKLQQFNTKRDKRQAELTQAETLTNGPDQEQEVMEERLQQLTEESQEAAETKRKLETDLKKAAAPVKAKERDIKTIEREEKAARRNLHDAKKALQDEREAILAAAGQSDEAKRAATLKEAEAEHDELVDKINHLKQATTMSLRKYEELEPTVESAKNETDGIARQMQGITHELRGLEESGGADSLAMFGRSCTKIDKMVKQAQKEGRWTGPVAGPIGAHIHVAAGKEKYAAIAEYAIGSKSLDRYVVTNNHDRQLFQHIRERAKCHSSECGIYQISNSPRYNVPPPPSADVETVVTCLNVDNDLIFNALVDHLRIETRAVCVSKETSERSLLVKDNRGASSIRGGTIREVFFLPHGDRWTVQNGNLSLVSNDRKLKQTLGVDKTAAIAELKVDADQVKKELDEAKAKHASLLNQHKAAMKQWNNERHQLRKSEGRLDDIVNKIEQVRAEAEESANVTVDTTELEQDVSNAEQTVEALKEQLAERQNELEALAPQVTEIKNRLTEVTARNEKILSDITAAEQDLQEHMQAMTQREEKVTSTRARLEKMQEIITKQEDNVRKLEKDRDATLRKARELQFRRNADQKRKEEEEENEDTLTPPSTEESAVDPTEEELEAIEPVEVRKEAAYYQSRIERAKKKIEDEKKRRRLKESDPQVAFEKYTRAQADLDGNLQQIEAIEENVALLAEDMEARRRKWRQFREHIVNMTRDTFNEILNRKGSAGDLDFSHKDGTLDLCVQKDSTQESTQTKDVKALSGGERSFTTLALLLALGERLETPFRVMDEFDVFLDPVARKIALDTLVEMAKEMGHRQFIFITPQDLSALKTDPKLKIHHMRPPARDGRVGGPSQQTLDFTQSSE